MIKKIFTFLLALATSVGLMNAAVDGKLPGAFTVDGSGTQVYFSQGNLQATTSDQGATWTWGFAENQWDYVGDNAANTSFDYWGGKGNGSYDLFGWIGASSALTDYRQYGIGSNYDFTDCGNTAGEDLKADWGSLMGSDWRTLTYDEWQYLIKNRDNAANLLAYATVNGKTGLILLPDSWTSSSVALTITTANYTTNIISASDWSTLEEQGCVFLPAAGWRSDDSVSGVGEGGDYWSSSSPSGKQYDEGSAYCFFFDTDFSKQADGMHFNKRGRGYGLSVRLVSETAPSGGSTPAELQVSEFEVPGSWNGDYDTELTASDFPGFVAASAAEAQAWSGAPASGWSYLIYAFEDGEAKVCEFEDGAFYGLVTESVRDDIYFRFEQGYQIYYTGTAPVYTLLSTITLQLENSQFVENHTNPNVASIGKSCNVTYAQYADYIAWKTDPWSSGEMLLVMPKAGYTFTKVVFTRDNNPSNKVTVYSAPFTASVTNSDNISQIEVYGEAETPAEPVVVASWTSNECAVVLTNDGKLTVSKNEYDGEMEDMNSYQSSKWRCFSDLITSIEVQEGVTHIGDYAFYNLQNVTSVSFPNSLTSIGDGAFMDCSITGDLVLPENLESIGEKCFSMVPKSLSTISVPASVTSIGMCAFENKGASDKTSTNVLTAINVAAANPNYCSVDGILYSKDMTTLIAYPAGKTATAYEIPVTVTEIKYNALYSCVNITDLTIPAGTSVIEENGGSNIVAFSGCYGLENIHNNATTPQSIYRVLSYWEDQGQDQINLYVPSGLGATYEAATGWQELNIIDSSTPTPTDEQVPTNADPENASYHYSTFFHSTQNYKLTNDGTTAFIADLSGNDLVLTEIAKGTQVIPANTAVILRKSGSTDPVVLTPTEENGVSFSAHNSLEGVDAVTTLASLSISAEECYVLSGSAELGVGFYKISGSSLKAHKAYVIYDGEPSGAPRRIRFVFDQATGVESIQPSAVSSQKMIENGQLVIIRNGVKYNAQGQIVK